MVVLIKRIIDLIEAPLFKQELLVREDVQFSLYGVDLFVDFPYDSSQIKGLAWAVEKEFQNLPPGF
jgi:hypothetical protein